MPATPSPSSPATATSGSKWRSRVANAGITYVPVNWHLVAAEIAYTLEDSGSKAVICGHHFRAETAKAFARPSLAGRRAGAGHRRRCARALEDSDPFQSYEAFLAAGSPDEPADRASVGRCSTPAAPPATRRVCAARSPACRQGADPAIWQLIGAGFANLVEGTGRTVLCGPVYHSAQWAYSFLPMIVGSATVMQHKYDSAGVLRLIDQYAATNVHLVPTQMKRLVDLPDDVKQTLRRVVAAAGAARRRPVSARVKQAMIDWWGPKISEYYGSTEGSVITMIDSEAVDGQGWQRRASRCPTWRSSSSPMTATAAGPTSRARCTSATRWAATSSTTTHRRRPPACTWSRACSPPAMSATSTTRGTCGSATARST